METLSQPGDVTRKKSVTPPASLQTLWSEKLVWILKGVINLQFRYHVHVARHPDPTKQMFYSHSLSAAPSPSAHLTNFLLFLLPSPSSRACCLRFYARRRTLRQRPSRCWSTCVPCRTSSSCQRLSATASIRRKESAAWQLRLQWAPLHSSALQPADLCRYQRVPCFPVFILHLGARQLNFILNVTESMHLM